MQPRYPVYIVSKGRWKTRQTAKALEALGVKYHIIVEPAEYHHYTAVCPAGSVLALPEVFQTAYDTCDDLGMTKSVGPGAARNFAWKHSTLVYHSKRHWVLDDNIANFHRLNHNARPKVTTPDIFAWAEGFVDRYENIALAGFNYRSFCKSVDSAPPFCLNTRIYSCLLIQNNIPYQWRGRYNEDTDLSLRVLKDGWCTLQFNAFLQDKTTTQRMSGGNTKEFYAAEGTLPKSKMLVDLHPDVAKLVTKFNRDHHDVNYKPFKNNKLIPVFDIPSHCIFNSLGEPICDT